MANIWQDSPIQENVDELERIKEVINAGIGLTALQAVYLLKLELNKAKLDKQELAYLRKYIDRLETENRYLKEKLDGRGT